MTSAPLSFGQLLQDRYELIESLGQGSHGEVWRGHDRLLDRLVALKVLKAEHVRSPFVARRFAAEARRAGKLSDLGIVEVFDIFADDGTPCIVMELIEGESLAALLAQQGRLSPRRTLGIVAQAALTLQAAHRERVVHRDVKPANLLLRADGLVKLTDFGVARWASDTTPQTKLNVVGIPAYLSPEQSRSELVDYASDLYALGVVAYECLSGRLPFTADNDVELALAHLRQTPAPLPGDVPAPVRQLVEQLMIRDAADRRRCFASAAELATRALALAAALKGAGGADEDAPTDEVVAQATMRLTTMPPESEPAVAAFEETPPTPPLGNRGLRRLFDWARPAGTHDPGALPERIAALLYGDLLREVADGRLVPPVAVVLRVNLQDLRDFGEDRVEELPGLVLDRLLAGAVDSELELPPAGVDIEVAADPAVRPGKLELVGLAWRDFARLPVLVSHRSSTVLPLRERVVVVNRRLLEEGTGTTDPQVTHKCHARLLVSRRGVELDPEGPTLRNRQQVIGRTRLRDGDLLQFGETEVYLQRRWVWGPCEIEVLKR
jgi:serine/threonine-protein kinase